MREKSSPIDLMHQTVCHQLQNAGDDIANGDGIVIDFDYDEETDDYMENMGHGVDQISTERTVTLELTYLLPE